MATDIEQLKRDANELAKVAKEMMDHIGEAERDLPSWLVFNEYVCVAIAKVQRHLDFAMSDLAAEITEYIRNVERKPTKTLEVIENIKRDAEITKQWPIATVKQWERAIHEAVQRGLLSKPTETIWVVVEPVASKPVQKGLFDE